MQRDKRNQHTQKIRHFATKKKRRNYLQIASRQIRLFSNPPVSKFPKLEKSIVSRCCYLI